MSDNIIGKRIKSARSMRNMTQRMVASNADMKRSQVSQFENGSRTPSIDNLIKLSQALCVSADYLIGNNQAFRLGNDKVNEIISLIEKIDEEKFGKVVEFLEELT